MTLTVDDILNQRGPTLRERANAALKARLAEEAAALEDEQDRLEGEALAMMREVLKLSDAEIHDVTLRRGRVNKENGYVEFTVDQVVMRVRYILENIMDANRSGMEEAIFEQVPVYEVRKATNWRPFKNLADLAAAL